MKKLPLNAGRGQMPVPRVESAPITAGEFSQLGDRHRDQALPVMMKNESPCRQKETPPACAVTEPSLSNRSNKWGQPWQQQAFRKTGSAQMLPTVHDPEMEI